MGNTSRKSLAVTVVGLLTILWGGAYIFLGGAVALAGEQILNNVGPNDPLGGLAPILQIVASLLVVLGVLWVLQGVPAILAGVGVLLRKPWGLVLTLLAALLAMFWSSFLLFSSDTQLIAIGSAQFLFGVLVFVILIARRKEFSRASQEIPST